MRSMSLDLVEMVMSVEEGFGIDIPDQVAAAFIAQRDIIDYLFSEFKDRYSRDETAKRVRQIIEYETGVDISKYKEDSHFRRDMGID